MESKKVKIATKNLRPGMYVSRLDRPWLETPFLFQGFRLKDEKQIARLREYCDHVYVDVEAGQKLHFRPIATTGMVAEQPRELVPEHRKVVYQDSAPVEKELQLASQLHARAAELARDIMHELRAGGHLEFSAIQRVINPMVDSVVRNPDAFLWLNELKKKDSYMYHRALHSSLLTLVVGRHIGLPKKDLQALALGSLLYDIGKTKLPEDLLNKPGRLTPQEFEVVKKHVGYSIQLLRETPGIEKQVLFMVRTHHERHDGSGYPMGLQGYQIPLFGRIIGLVDCFGAITSDRPYAPAMGTSQAIRSIYEWRDIDFQAELVEQFIQALGIYPTGSLVELSTGEVGAVISQNRLRRLRPKIMLILDPEKKPYGHFPIVDLIQETTDRHGRALEIVRGLDPGSFGINTEEMFLL